MITAVYYDGMFERVCNVTLKHLSETTRNMIDEKIFQNHKNRLYVVAQNKNNMDEIRFEMTDKRRLPHMKEFDICDMPTSSF